MSERERKLEKAARYAIESFEGTRRGSLREAVALLRAALEPERGAAPPTKEQA